MYLDDGIIVGKDYQTAKLHAELVRNKLRNLGFQINFKKSVWSPTQEIEWLGIHIDSRKMVFSLPKDKIERLTNRINHLLQTRYTSARELLRVVGGLVSAKYALGVFSHPKGHTIRNFFHPKGH